jgi:CRISPR/Cas system-associated protein Cas5 (RAMP superfamily)
MDIYQIKNFSDEERQTLLVGESVKVEEQAYMKALSEEELQIRRERIVQVSLLKAVVEDEFQTVKDEFKMKLDPLKEEFSQLLDELRVKMVEVTGKVYTLPDHENQMMHFIDERGNVLSSRRMLPEERQYRIPMSQHLNFTVNERTGSED